jgi:predicted aspartyl protease
VTSQDIWEEFMRYNNRFRPLHVGLALIVVLVLCPRVSRADWEERELDGWVRGRQIRAIRFPKGEPQPDGPQASTYHSATARGGSLAVASAASSEISAAAGSQFSIDSPPVDGFVPWIVTTLTDKRLGELELDAVPVSSPVGRFLTSAPEADYAIAILDTGAGINTIGAADAERIGLFDHSPSMLTPNTTDFQGAGGMCSGWVSQPLGLFVGGLERIDAAGLLSDTDGMVGQTNVSIAVGDPVDSPGLPSLVGTPLLIYVTSVIRNDQEIAVSRDDTLFVGPDVQVYEHSDPRIPQYEARIPLELRPAGIVGVQYFPDLLDPFDPQYDRPLFPSMATGFLPTQAWFFASSVDLTHNGRSAIDRDGFMVDTGASVTVISEAIAARLGLDPLNPEMELEILDACGDIVTMPGYWIDSLELTAVPQWLSYTNVPVFVLDVTSVEGGTLDGILGMNLLTEFNLVVRGGGIPGQPTPVIEFERIAPRLVGDIAPVGGDGVVDFLDLAALADAWLSSFGTPNWNPKADLAWVGNPDEVVDGIDFAAFAAQWGAIAAP